MLTAALFTIAKLRKQPKCHQKQGHKKVVVPSRNEILFSYKKKNEILSFVTAWMGLEGIMLREMAKTNAIRFHIYVESIGQNK